MLKGPCQAVAVLCHPEAEFGAGVFLDADFRRLGLEKLVQTFGTGKYPVPALRFFSTGDGDLFPAVDLVNVEGLLGKLFHGSALPVALAEADAAFDAGSMTKAEVSGQGLLAEDP